MMIEETVIDTGAHSERLEEIGEFISVWEGASRIAEKRGEQSVRNSFLLASDLARHAAKLYLQAFEEIDKLFDVKSFEEMDVYYKGDSS